MEFKELLMTIVSIVLTALLPHAIRLINEYISDKRIAKAFLIVTDAVFATAQVFVDEMKKSGQWDDFHKKQAFERARANAISLLTPQIKKELTKIYGDIDLWLDTVIESTVRISNTK